MAQEPRSLPLLSRCHRGSHSQLSTGRKQKSPSLFTLVGARKKKTPSPEANSANQPVPELTLPRVTHNAPQGLWQQPLSHLSVVHLLSPASGTPHFRSLLGLLARQSEGKGEAQEILWPPQARGPKPKA